MNRAGHFLSDKQQGDIDEKPILEHLASRGYEAEKTTLKEDKFGGIDYWLTKVEKRTSIQIKCCRQISKYNNFYMQISKCIGDEAKGKAIKASRFLYYDVVNRKMYDFATKDMQAAWSEIVAHGKYHEKIQTNGSKTNGYIISIEKMKTLFPIREIQL